MNTTKLVTLICWIVVAAVLIGLAIWLLTGNLFGFRTGFKIQGQPFSIGSFRRLTGPFNEVGTYEAPGGEIDSIDVNWVAGTVTITPYDGDVVKVTEYARRSLEEDEKLICSVAGGTLKIQYCSPDLRINTLTKKLEVLVPKTLADKLKLLDVAAASASIKISDFSADTIHVKEASGETELSNIKAISAEVISVSGAVHITDMEVSRLSVGAVSGGIRLSGVSADTLESNTTSGGQELEGAFKDIDAGSVSGGIRINSGINPDSMDCRTTSGGMTVTIPGGVGDLVASYSTTSGKFHSDIPIITNGSAAYRFSSTSGDIWLKAAK
jgi:DUF4097 and DUF4098 domain-containing protein YvlB